MNVWISLAITSWKYEVPNRVVTEKGISKFLLDDIKQNN
jgi:hypothetical protein